MKNRETNPIERSMVESCFSQEHVDAMRPHIQETVDNLLDAMVKGGSEKPVDLVEKFSLPVPSYVSPFEFTDIIMTASRLTSILYCICR